MLNEIRADMLKVKRMVSDVEMIIGKREGETELVNKLIDAENLLTYCMSRLENALLPPCKVGDELYAVGSITQQITTLKVAAVQTAKNDMFLLCDGGVSVSVNQQLNKSAFRTREEAEEYRERLKNEHTA